MKAELRSRLDQYRSQIIAADLADIPAIKSEFYEWYNSVSEEDRLEMKPFWQELKKEAWQIVEEVKGLIEELKALKEEELAEARK